MGLSCRMCSQEPVITLFLISLLTPLFITIWRGCQRLAWWQNQTHWLGVLPASRGKSWREKAFLQFTLVCPATLLHGVGHPPAVLTQAALPLNKTTSSSSGIQNMPIRTNLLSLDQSQAAGKHQFRPYFNPDSPQIKAVILESFRLYVLCRACSQQQRNCFISPSLLLCSPPNLKQLRSILRQRFLYFSYALFPWRAPDCRVLY